MRHHVLAAADDHCRAGQRCRRFHAVGVGVAGGQIVVQDAGFLALHEAARRAQQPHARHGVAADGGARRMRPRVDHGDGLGLLVLCRAQQDIGDRHWHRSAEQRYAGDADRVAEGTFECGQRTHAVTDQRNVLRRVTSADSLQQQFDPVGQIFDRRQRLARAAAMAGQIDGQYGKTVVGKPAALQAPDAVIVLRAVDEHDAGQAGIEGLAAGVGVGRLTIDFDLHGQAFAAAARPRFRSSIRSPMSSRPIDRRMVPGWMPAATRAASDMRKWVVDAG